ncbi:MAG TPA: histidinol-phosphate transaminase [Coriobacteriia bacterium]
MDWSALIRPELDGMKPYAPGLRASEVRERTGCDDVSKLSSNEYPLGPTPRAVEAMAAVLPHLNRYSDGSCHALKGRLASHWGVDERFLAIANGSNELLRLIAQAVLSPGDEVVYAWPSFVVYPMVTRMFGAIAVPVALTSDARHDLPAMLAACTERTRLMFLCNPNNPTGTIFTRDEWESFLAAVPEHVLVVLDEAYFEFVDDGAYPDGLKYFDGERPIVVARTFSKIYSLAGARIGYGFLPEPLLAAVDAIREPFNVNTVAQIGAFYSLEDQPEVVARKHVNREQKTYLYSCFDRLGIGYVPSHTNFVWVMTEKPAEAFEDLLREGVIVRSFGDTPALRVGVGTEEDTRRTVAALEAIVGRRGSF